MSGNEERTSSPRDLEVNHYEDFEVGRAFRHHWGRSITRAEAVAFATEHLQHQPAQFNQVYAEYLGYRDIVVDPSLVFSVTLGMSVEDLSESGGPFLGADGVKYLQPVYPDDTLFASSRVVSKRLSTSRPGFGIVEWETWSTNQEGERVVEFRRTNLVRLRQDALDQKVADSGRGTAVRLEK